jgi:radical SAM protein with 4Fe4S-binding SPASM domain
MNKDFVLPFYFNLAYRKNCPISVTIELLTMCNLDCEHCYLPDHTNAGLNTERIKEILYDLRRMGVMNISFTGGEIFLRNDLFELIEFTRKLYMRVFLMSNGTILTEKQAERLSELSVAEFSTTLFSMNHQIHDRITRRKGSLEALLSSLQLLKRYGIRVRVKTPIMQSNVHSVKCIQNYCSEQGFSFSASPVIYAKNDGDSSPTALRAAEDHLRLAVEMVDEFEDRHENILHRFDVPCAALYCFFSIDSYGDVYPCNALLYKVGNIYENSLLDIWNHSKELQYVKGIKCSDLTECSGCEYKNICERCPGMALLDHGDLLACDTLAKAIAKIRAF